MIAFDFIYCRPQTAAEAASAYSGLAAEGKTALYYGGGSEIITMCRAGSIRPDAVIDLKDIAECNQLAKDADSLIIGAACSLSRIKDSRLFPLLSLCCGRIADHSNQCRITLGGNLCGSIIYRETVLPLLLAGAELDLCGPEGVRSLPIEAVFPGRMQLKAGEFILCARLPLWATIARHAHIKRAAAEKIDYPLLTVAALEKEGALCLAFSGLCGHPFRSGEMEAALNQRNASAAQRAEQAAGLLPAPVLDDSRASARYRLFVLKNTLRGLVEEWEHA